VLTLDGIFLMRVGDFMTITDSKQRLASTPHPDQLTLAAYTLIVILAGSNAVAVRFTVMELPPFWGATLRFAAAALIFWLFVLFRRSSIPTGRALAGVILYGFLSFGASYAFIYWGIKSIPAGLTQVILALVPLLTFFAAYIHRIEPFRWRGLVGALLAVIGIAWAFFHRPGEGIPLFALLAVIMGAACIAESTIVIKLFPRSDPFVTNALGMTSGAVTLILLSLISGESWTLPTRMATWISILYLILVGSVIVFYLFLYILTRWTASATSFQFVLFPFVTVLVAAWLAGEKVNVSFLFGGALVLVGVWLGALSDTSSSSRL
jgi:drug/metabolite transporter (DMT)-like permease